MRTVGAKELRDHTSEILREVQKGQVIEITSRGATIARLIPAREPALTDEDIEAILEDLDNLAAEINARWPKGVSAQDAIDDVRH